MMNYEIRLISKDEYPILEDFLYEAIYIPEGTAPHWLILIELDKNAKINDDIKVSITNSPDITSPFGAF